MASILKVDEMQGVTSAGDITITDGSATSSLQSGLVKAWGAANRGSLRNSGFNISSITDNQTGDNSFNYTNNFTDNDYGASALAYGPSSGQQEGTSSTRSIGTAAIRIVCFDEHKNSSGRFDTTWQGLMVAGDLA